MSKLEPEIPPIKPIYIERQIPPPTWWAGIAAANRTAGGSVVMALIFLCVGYVWGYYTKYKSYQVDGIQIVTQALNNEKLDDESQQQMQQRSDDLVATLTQLKYSQSEIEFLLKGNINTLDKIKTKFGGYFNDDELYLPRDDCNNDYFGREASDEINQAILKRFEKSAGENNE